ncbi:MAG: 2-keto-4-pentenoate hydratase, partial [Acidimicrobiales bacterium]
MTSAEEATAGKLTPAQANADQTVLAELADRLWEAERSGVPTGPIRDSLPAGDVSAAYAVQRINTQRSLDQGRRRVGVKAGLTSAAVQRQLGVHQPDFGVLFADMAVADSEEMEIDRVLQAKVEAEVALVMERDLPHADLTPAELMAAVAFALPAIEVVGSRVAGWDIAITDTIAD